MGVVLLPLELPSSGGCSDPTWRLSSAAAAAAMTVAVAVEEGLLKSDSRSRGKVPLCDVLMVGVVYLCALFGVSFVLQQLIYGL